MVSRLMSPSLFPNNDYLKTFEIAGTAHDYPNMDVRCQSNWNMGLLAISSQATGAKVRLSSQSQSSLKIELDNL